VEGKTLSGSLEVNGLCANIGKFSLENIDLNLEPGTIMGFIGKNGAGKTTFIKTILDIIPKTGGDVLFFGKKMADSGIEIKSRVGVVFDALIYPQSYHAKTVKNAVAPFYKNFDGAKWQKLMHEFELDPDKKLNEYSKGMQMKFQIVMALAHDPELLILDEPTAGLDPVARAEFLDMLYDIIANERNSVLFSTHITSDLDKIADYITMIDGGRIVFSRAKDEMLDSFALVRIDKENADGRVKSMFLGCHETSFGIEGVMAKELAQSLGFAKTARPTVEDIMVYNTNSK
jgi:ABC-2 type transport system ATP-binding protein